MIARLIEGMFGRRAKADELRRIADTLAAENEALRSENQKLHVLARALRDVNEHLDKRLIAAEVFRRDDDTPQHGRREN